ncbi:hypothetical protein COCOBI_09-0450 [Coccomyxa sp. Obi]|nr:hypothetical protein COCOBI_09-0450 [Coccomyxa sp. Obi]
MLEIVLGRYGAVSAERSEEGVCGVLGVSSTDLKEDPWRELKAVQCALDLLDAIQEMQLPGGGTLPARIGLHSGEAADGLVGCANTLQYRLAGPALSIAKALAKAAPWDGILASVCMMPGQFELGHLWQRAEPLPVSDGTLDTYLLPVQAAPAYAEHPSAPQFKTRGPSDWTVCKRPDWTVCKRPCASAAWRVHDGGTALHGGLPPGYQAWTLSVRATAASFAGRHGPGALAAAAGGGPKPPSPAPAASGSMPAPDDMPGPSSSHAPAAMAAAAPAASGSVPAPDDMPGPSSSHAPAAMAAAAPAASGSMPAPDDMPGPSSSHAPAAMAAAAPAASGSVPAPYDIPGPSSSHAPAAMAAAAPAASGSMPAPDDMPGPSSSHAPAAMAAAKTGVAAGKSEQQSQRAAEATAAFRLLQDSSGGSEQGSPEATSSDKESASSADGSGALEDSQGSSDGNVHSSWQPQNVGCSQSALTGAQAPMGLAAFPTPRPRRWVSVAPSAWDNPVSDAGLGFHSLPILDDSLLLGIAEPAPSSRTSAPRRFPSVLVSAPAGSTDRSETTARTLAAQAASRSAQHQPTVRPAAAARQSVARPGVPGSMSAPGQPAARVEVAALPMPVQLRRPLSTLAPDEPVGRPEAAARALADSPVVAAPAQSQLRLRGGRHSQKVHEDIAASCCDHTTGRTVQQTGCSSRGVQLVTEAESAASCWRGVAAAAAARFGVRQDQLACLDLSDGTSILQDAKLEFKDLTLEERFRAMWARQKRGHDSAVLLFFLAMFLLREMPPMLSLGATGLPSPVGLAAACFMLALLALMHFNQEFYERRRSAFSTLTRMIRTFAVSWHHFQGLGMGKSVAGGSCQTGLPFFSILTKNALPLAAMSLCEGNLLSAHLLGDALALAAAVAQAPCLCGGMGSLLGRSGCALLVVLQAFGALLLPTAMMYMLERRVRLAFLHSVFAPGGKGAAADQEGFEGISTARCRSGACSGAEALPTSDEGKAGYNRISGWELPSAESPAVRKSRLLKL